MNRCVDPSADVLPWGARRGAKGVGGGWHLTCAKDDNVDSNDDRLAVGG